MMRRILALTLALAGGLSPAWAQDRDAIEAVIGSQLEAFVDRDIATAWSHASPMIKGMFGTPSNFGMMVERGYPMVWDNAERDFQELEGTEAQAMQKVFVRDAQGQGWFLLYEMIETPDGWKINGVRVLPAPELAA